MMSKDAKPLPDLATDSQAKYKEMKQTLIMQINVSKRSSINEREL